MVQSKENQKINGNRNDKNAVGHSNDKGKSRYELSETMSSRKESSLKFADAYDKKKDEVESFASLSLDSPPPPPPPCPSPVTQLKSSNTNRDRTVKGKGDQSLDHYTGREETTPEKDMQTVTSPAIKMGMKQVVRQSRSDIHLSQCVHSDGEAGENNKPLSRSTSLPPLERSTIKGDMTTTAASSNRKSEHDNKSQTVKRNRNSLPSIANHMYRRVDIEDTETEESGTHHRVNQGHMQRALDSTNKMSEARSTMKSGLSLPNSIILKDEAKASSNDEMRSTTMAVISWKNTSTSLPSIKIDFRENNAGTHEMSEKNNCHCSQDGDMKKSQCNKGNMEMNKKEDHNNKTNRREGSRTKRGGGTRSRSRLSDSGGILAHIGSLFPPISPCARDFFSDKKPKGNEGLTLDDYFSIQNKETSITQTTPQGKSLDLSTSLNSTSCISTEEKKDASPCSSEPSPTSQNSDSVDISICIPRPFPRNLGDEDEEEDEGDDNGEDEDGTFVASAEETENEDEDEDVVLYYDADEDEHIMDILSNGKGGRTPGYEISVENSIIRSAHDSVLNTDSDNETETEIDDDNISETDQDYDTSNDDKSAKENNSPKIFTKTYKPKERILTAPTVAESPSVIPDVNGLDETYDQSNCSPTLSSGSIDPASPFINEEAIAVIVDEDDNNVHDTPVAAALVVEEEEDYSTDTDHNLDDSDCFYLGDDSSVAKVSPRPQATEEHETSQVHVVHGTAKWISKDMSFSPIPNELPHIHESELCKSKPSKNRRRERKSTSAMKSTMQTTPQTKLALGSDKDKRRDVIKRGKWSLGSKLGVGSFGVVHVGMDHLTGNLMAVKSLSIPHSSRTDMTEDLSREIDLMRSLRHPNIVRYIGAEVDTEKGTLYIFQEWVPGGSVASLLHKFGPFPMPVVRSYLQQILSGLAYLHSHRILHRDIKGGNILVNNDGVVKLADFGASKRLETLKSENDREIEDMMESLTMRGTPYFMAPEVFEEKYGTKADVWSVGGVAYQMCTGTAPWKGMGFTNPTSLYLHLKSHESPPKMTLPDMDDEETHHKEPISCAGRQLMTLIRRCFCRDPSGRPSASSLLNDPFFSVTEGDDSSSDEEGITCVRTLASVDDPKHHGSNSCSLIQSQKLIPIKKKDVLTRRASPLKAPNYTCWKPRTISGYARSTVAALASSTDSASSPILSPILFRHSKKGTRHREKKSALASSTSQPSFAEGETRRNLSKSSCSSRLKSQKESDYKRTQHSDTLSMKKLGVVSDDWPTWARKKTKEMTSSSQRKTNFFTETGASMKTAPKLSSSNKQERKIGERQKSRSDDGTENPFSRRRHTVIR